MSERSSLHNALLAFVALAGCGGAKPPEADPAEAKALAAKMVENMPLPSTTRACTDADFKDVTTTTWRTIRIVGGQTVPPAEDFKSIPTQAAWTNPVGLESPSLLPLIDDKASETAKRRAAHAFTKAKALIVYTPDAVNAALALQVKHLATGTMHARAIRFENAIPICVQLVEFQNTKERTEWAIIRTTKAIVDPEVAQAMREDMIEQYYKHAPTTKKSAPPSKK